MLKRLLCFSCAMFPLVASSFQVPNSARGFTNKKIFSPNAYVRFFNTDPKATIQLLIHTKSPRVVFSCGSQSNLTVTKKSNNTYRVDIPPSTYAPVAAGANPDTLCKFAYYVDHKDEFYYLDGDKPVTIQGLYEGSVVVSGTLELGVAYPMAVSYLGNKPDYYQKEVAYLPSKDTNVVDNHAGAGKVCRPMTRAAFPFLYVPNPEPVATNKNVDKNFCTNAQCPAKPPVADTTSIITGTKPTIKIMQRINLDVSAMPFNGAKCDNAAKYGKYDLGPSYTGVVIRPQGIAQVDADTSYVEVLNETNNTIYWGYTDLYNFFANGQAFDALSASEKIAAYQAVAPGQSGYLNVHKTDSFSVGIQAGHNLLTLYKKYDDAQTKAVGNYYWSVLTADLMSNNATGSAQSDEGFALIPEMMDEDGRPIAVCTNVKPDKPIDLIDGKTLLITVYDPTSFQKPSTCYSADVSQGFNASGYNAGGV